MSETAWVITDDDIDWAERRINLTEVIARDAGAVRWPILLKWLLSSPRKRGVLAFTSGAERSVADCFDVLADDLLSRATPSAPADPESGKVEEWTRVDEEGCPHWSTPMGNNWQKLRHDPEFLDPAQYPIGTRLTIQKPAPQPASADAGETGAVIKGPGKKSSWSVGDIITVPAHSGGFRVWRVVGVFLGGEHQESVIELETLDRLKNTEGRMCVPEELLCGVFPAFASDAVA